MKNRKYLIVILIAVLGFTNSCDVLEPEDSDVYYIDDVTSVVTFAEGILINAYRNIPAGHQTFNLSYASDDALTNDVNSGIKNVVAGGWTDANNPFSMWNTSYESIFYLNSFFDIMDEVVWEEDDDVTNELYAEKLKGEAHALRAWNYFHLLQAHAGLGTDGQMLGVPIVDKVLELDPAEYELQRATLNELVAFILEDCDQAIDLLPARWVNSGQSNVDIAIGARNTNRINGLVARLIKAKTLLYAASPSYADGVYNYQMAADAAVEIMDLNNGLTGLSSTRTDFYSDAAVPNSNNDHVEVIWYSRRLNSENSWEKTNYPPSFYGQGRTNPTQDLVNAFPMLDGTPTPANKINSNDPYSGRDPRLDMFIMYDGASYAAGSLNTRTGSVDALGSPNIFATATGYYLRKFLNTSSVNVDPNVDSKGMRYYTYARYTDVLLMFAEAANEIGGPDAAIGGYTAREVINAIRDRAGITSTAYVDGLSKAQMTDLIRNERRLEMCFEKQRFWDLRRWGMTNEMKAPVNGVQISEDGSVFNYLQVEERNYSDFQIYGPVPFGETIKYDIIQNQGW